MDCVGLIVAAAFHLMLESVLFKSTKAHLKQHVQVFYKVIWSRSVTT